jgi:hypothetical protein
MDHDIRKARIATLERYIDDNGTDKGGADAKIYSMFLTWYAEPYMKGSRTKTIALAKRMLAELKKEQQVLYSLMHTHTLPDGTVTAAASGPSHPNKDHRLDDEPDNEVHGQA